MITFFTLVLDGMPWLGHHYPEFCKLSVPWRWIVVEGVADNVNCTSWCAKIAPRLSNDGTTEYLRHLCATDKRVTHLYARLWNGKVEMCNAALAEIKEPCLLWQVDADELWTAKQISDVHFRFCVDPSINERPRNCAYFYCRYFVGPDRYIANRGCYGNHDAYEWKRAWRFEPGMRFQTHEPPVIEGMTERPFTHQVTERVGAVFDHMAYSTRKQMEFRSRYYAGSTNPNAHLWKNCVEGWARLQAVREFPVKLNQFFPWVDDRAEVVKLQ